MVVVVVASPLASVCLGVFVYATVEQDMNELSYIIKSDFFHATSSFFKTYIYVWFCCGIRGALRSTPNTQHRRNIIICSSSVGRQSFVGTPELTSFTNMMDGVGWSTEREAQSVDNQPDMRPECFFYFWRRSNKHSIIMQIDEQFLVIDRLYILPPQGNTGFLRDARANFCCRKSPLYYE